MSTFLKLMYRQAESKAASNLCDYASVKLELACINERLAEIESQHEPLNSLSPDPEIRKKMLAAAFYVVVGRLRTEEPKEDSK